MRQRTSAGFVAVFAAVGAVSVLLGATDGPPGTLKGDLAPAEYERVVKPIEIKLALVEKAVASYEKEMQRPEEKRNAATLVACQEKVSAACYQVVLAARKSAKLVKKDEHKAEIKSRFEDPNLRKATDILLRFAAEAEEKGDLRTAVAYYKRVLGMDPDNEQAKAALERIAAKLKKAAEKTTKDRKKDDKDKSSWKRIHRS